ncbi:MAG: ribose-phosphate pyrophosphokinase [Lachnospiraceae bacterium]|nr:ribose-phosphate pyrophosphokinase [Lachnospiraceae bacterium]
MAIDIQLDSLPTGPLKIAALEGCRDFAKVVDKDLSEMRRKSPLACLNFPLKGYVEDSYLVDFSCPRYGTGEGRGIINDSVRGADLYIMIDVLNYSITYKVCGEINHMSPDNHYEDLKRVISAANGKAKRITVIMPFLFGGRQHRRTKRESLDCAIFLEELANMGVSNIVTFDAHDPRVQNAIPLSGFDSFMPTYQFLKALIQTVPDLHLTKDTAMVVSPDEGAMERSVYFANILGLELGMFYKRRDYTKIVNGKNPIVAHEFLGSSVEGKDILVIDDMISSGGSMLDVARQIKERGANKVFICTTFGLFTDGLDAFDEYYEKGYISKVVTTNLNYRPPELLTREWYAEADMTEYLASIIDHLNHDLSISEIQSPTKKINRLLDQLNRD